MGQEKGHRGERPRSYPGPGRGRLRKRQPGLAHGLALRCPRVVGFTRGHRAYGGGKHLRVGQREYSFAGVEPDVSQAYLGHRSFEDAAHRAGSDPYTLADVEWPRQQQDDAGEEVRHALLAGDAEQHGGQRAAEYELADPDPEQVEGDDERRDAADEQDGVADNGGV